MPYSFYKIINNLKIINAMQQQQQYNVYSPNKQQSYPRTLAKDHQCNVHPQVYFRLIFSSGAKGHHNVKFYLRTHPILHGMQANLLLCCIHSINWRIFLNYHNPLHFLSHVTKSKCPHIMLRILHIYLGYHTKNLLSTVILLKHNHTLYQDIFRIFRWPKQSQTKQMQLQFAFDNRKKKIKEKHQTQFWM
eukprot:TRINITY_DN1326_c2_g1_i2.p3 TRINITY_DN1326_c2_g1~~TRINITY_DN1326_c2_g1_i2.p3  ORF type:complete len:190 (+),score=-10.86 TRINITY_DN1326_c2_g1_i2:181-750(+)